MVEAGGHQRIKLDNFYVLGGTASTGDERMQAHVPLLLHPAPRNVAFLGLGTGITAGAALLHPVERVTVLEIVPGVVAVARDYFRAANLGPRIGRAGDKSCLWPESGMSSSWYTSLRGDGERDGAAADVYPAVGRWRSQDGR